MHLIGMSTLLILLSLGPGYHHPLGPGYHNTHEHVQEVDIQTTPMLGLIQHHAINDHGGCLFQQEDSGGTCLPL
jgi:hypothetical protein